MNGSQTSLCPHPPSEAVVECFWGRRPSSWRLFNGEKSSGLDRKAYFDYYGRQWEYFSQQGSICFQGFDDLGHVIAQLKQGVSREDVILELERKHQTGTSQAIKDQVFQNSVNFAARVLVMAKLGRLQHEAFPARCLDWDSGPLREFLAHHFCAAPQLGCDSIRLAKTFDAWSLENVGGVRVEFTDNLVDHLRLVDDDQVVLVFHHASFLEYQNNSDSLLPTGLAEETLRTLALLFPQAEFGRGVGVGKRKQKWLRALCDQWAERSRCQVDRRLSSCGTLPADGRQIAAFHCWRDRLVILKQTYDDATPRTVKQWWYDRRNGSQWYPFWIALMVFAVATLLGLVQCIEGALQVYRAYYPPDL